MLDITELLNYCSSDSAEVQNQSLRGVNTLVCKTNTYTLSVFDLSSSLISADNECAFVTEIQFQPRS